MTVERPFTFRWLGVNGIEICGQETCLAVDPFFTRPPFCRLWTGRVSPDIETIVRHIRPYRYILVTHNHYDHVMDVPVIARKTGADVYGSENTCDLLLRLGLSPAKIHLLHAGDQMDLDEFTIEVYPARHLKTPVDRLVNGPLPVDFDPPLRLTDYRMDECFSYRIIHDRRTLLVGEAPAAVEVQFASPLNPDHFIHHILPVNHPRLVVLIHWDDFFRPLSKPIRPMLQPPNSSHKFFRPIDLEWIKEKIKTEFPETQVLIPEIFKDYEFLKDEHE